MVYWEVIPGNNTRGGGNGAGKGKKNNKRALMSSLLWATGFNPAEEFWEMVKGMTQNCPLLRGRKTKTFPPTVPG